jgi:hypothetical protein
VTPGRELGIETGHQAVGDNPHRGRRRVEQTVVAGMRGMGLEFVEALDDEIDRCQRVVGPRKVEWLE